MKKLLIMRHAKTEEPGEVPDFQRSLTKRGQKDSELVAHLLKRLELVPSVILASPAERARETAELLAEAGKFDCHVVFKDEFYPGNRDAYVQALHKLPVSYDNVLLIGHNPVLEELVSWLSASGKLALHLSTASLAVIESDCEYWHEFEPGQCRLKLLLNPHTIREFC